MLEVSPIFMLTVLSPNTNATITCLLSKTKMLQKHHIKNESSVCGSRAASARLGRPPSTISLNTLDDLQRAAAPGLDQPVHAGHRLCGRPGAAIAANSTLAVRDCPKRVLSRKQHSQQSPPPADDVYLQQHPCYTTHLP